jgi:hypothetical protein
MNQTLPILYHSPVGFYSVLDQEDFVADLAIDQLIHDSLCGQNAEPARPHAHGFAQLEMRHRRVWRIRYCGMRNLIPPEPFAGVAYIKHNRPLGVYRSYFNYPRGTKVSLSQFSFTATLTGYAYETIPGKAIIAGATKGPEDAEPTATLSSHTPEPVTLGVLALGAPGLSIWRRDEPVAATSDRN